MTSRKQSIEMATSPLFIGLGLRPHWGFQRLPLFKTQETELSLKLWSDNLYYQIWYLFGEVLEPCSDLLSFVHSYFSQAVVDFIRKPPRHSPAAIGDRIPVSSSGVNAIKLYLQTACAFWAKDGFYKFIKVLPLHFVQKLTDFDVSFWAKVVNVLIN